MSLTLSTIFAVALQRLFDQPAIAGLNRPRIHLVELAEHRDLPAEIDTGVFITSHSTPSEHGGVVSDPMYAK